jgi:hypothetical protein
MSQYYKHDGNSANCSLKNGENWRKFFPPYPPTTAQGAWVPEVPAVTHNAPGTFTDYPGAPQTKSVTVVACYVECAPENQVPQGRVNGTTVDVPPPFDFGSWVDNGDGTFTRVGTMNTSTPWTEEYKDGKTGKVCWTDSGNEPGTRPEIEKRGAGVCEIVTDWQYISSTDPVLNETTLLYEWDDLYRKFDVYNDQGKCDEKVVPMKSGYNACLPGNTTSKVEKGNMVVRDKYTGEVCSSECYPTWDRKYKMATFEKEGQPNCYLVSWDEDYAPNASRQLCNCGWIADNMSDFEWVEVNSCTGAVRYDGMDWGKFYNEDLIYPHWGNKACLNVGGC